MLKTVAKIIFMFSDLPEKIQKHLPYEISQNFVAGLKTLYKPNATIPILWLIVHNEGILFCNTHKTRGIFKIIDYNEINSIKIYSGTEFNPPKIRIIFLDIEREDFEFSIPIEIELENLGKILLSLDYEVIKRF